MAHVTIHHRQPAAQQLGEGGLAVAVGAEQRNAVIAVNAQVDVLQDRLAGLVTDGGFLEAHQRRVDGPRRGREHERRHPVFQHVGDWLHLLQRLEPRLGLARLRCLGAEPVDERLHVGAGVFLLLLHLQLQGSLLAPDTVEGVIVALVERQLQLVEMQDRVDRLVEQVLVVADDENRMPVGADVAFQPDHAFQVEIVGGLVEQQHIRLGEQRRGKGHPHPPAAGKCGAGLVLRRLVEAETGKDGGRAGRGGVRVDIGQPRLYLGDAVRVVRGLGFRQQACPLGVGGQHHLDQRFGTARRFLRHGADAGVFRHRAGARLRLQFAEDQLEQGGLAGTIAPDEADLVPGRQRHRGMVDQQASLDAVCQVIDVQHGCRAV